MTADAAITEIERLEATSLAGRDPGRRRQLTEETVTGSVLPRAN